MVVTGPNESRQEATLVAAENSGGQHWVATYQIAAPGGVWDESDAGIYTIEMLDHAVLDINGRHAEAGVLGGFAFMPEGSSVASAPFAPQAWEVTITPVTHGTQSGLPTAFRVDLYPVTDWPPGGCVFVLRVHGRMIRIEGFPTPAQTTRLVPVMPAGVASGSEGRGSPSAEPMFFTAPTADAAAVPAFPFLADFNDGLLDALAHDTYRSRGH